MKRVLFPLILSLTCTSAFAKEIALTIDDVPMPRGQLSTGLEKTRRILETLKKEGIQTAVFCNTAHLGQDDGVKRVKMYGEAGHTIANHTSSHPDLEKVGAEKFIKAIDDADKTFSGFEGFKKWFRFPYLREGATTEERDTLRKHLQETGYRNAYVTVNSFDYWLDDVLQKAKKKNTPFDLDKACVFLSDLVIEGLANHNHLAKRHLKKDVRHVLLMHENDITATCLPKLITTLKSKGWTIIALAKAYEDETLAAEPETLWQRHGRVAAAVAAKDGYQFDSKWEDFLTVKKEMIRRGIVQP